MELMASRIAKLIKGQDQAQGEQLAVMPRKCVRTVCTNALGVGREVTAKPIAGRFLLLLLLILFVVKRGPSVSFAKASGSVREPAVESPPTPLIEASL